LSDAQATPGLEPPPSRAVFMRRSRVRVGWWIAPSVRSSVGLYEHVHSIGLERVFPAEFFGDLVERTRDRPCCTDTSPRRPPLPRTAALLLTPPVRVAQPKWSAASSCARIKRADPRRRWQPSGRPRGRRRPSPRGSRSGPRRPSGSRSFWHPSSCRRCRGTSIGTLCIFISMSWHERASGAAASQRPWARRLSAAGPSAGPASYTDRMRHFPKRCVRQAQKVRLDLRTHRLNRLRHYETATAMAVRVAWRGVPPVRTYEN